MAAFDNIPGGLDPKGLDIKTLSFLSEEDIRLQLLVLAYKGRIAHDWTLEQVRSELESLTDIFYGDEPEKE